MTSNTEKPKAEILLDWLSELSFVNLEESKWKILENPSGKVRVQLFTNDHCYSISAHSADDRNPRGYLGCVASARKPRAGEDWTRGNDLPDGPLTREVFNVILKAIVGYELVPIVRRSVERVEVSSGAIDTA